MTRTALLVLASLLVTLAACSDDKPASSSDRDLDVEIDRDDADRADDTPDGDERPDTDDAEPDADDADDGDIEADDDADDVTPDEETDELVELEINRAADFTFADVAVKRYLIQVRAKLEDGGEVLDVWESPVPGLAAGFTLTDDTPAVGLVSVGDQKYDALLLNFRSANRTLIAKIVPRGSGPWDVPESRTGVSRTALGEVTLLADGVALRLQPDASCASDPYVSTGQQSLLSVGGTPTALTPGVTSSTLRFQIDSPVGTVQRDAGDPTCPPRGVVTVTIEGLIELDTRGVGAIAD